MAALELAFSRQAPGKRARLTLPELLLVLRQASLREGAKAAADEAARALKAGTDPVAAAERTAASMDRLFDRETRRVIALHGLPPPPPGLDWQINLNTGELALRADPGGD